jgi:general secretion pathway protein D
VLSSLAAVSKHTVRRGDQANARFNDGLADDKQTIVLGGLIQDDLQDTLKKVPLLGDIPLLGKLFQNVEKKRVKRNLLVFLRPTVLRTAEDIAEATNRKYENVWEVKIQSETTSAPPPPLDSIYDGRSE